MATLSKKMDLTAGIWQEIGSSGFVGQKDQTSTLEIVNADALPVGDVPEAQSIVGSANLQFVAPVSGSLFVRVKHGTGTLKLYWA